MASYRGHLTFSSMLGAANGIAATMAFDVDWGVALMAAGITAVCGLLPDLDSQSGVPVREMFNLAAVLLPLMMLKRLFKYGLTEDQVFAVLGMLYIFIRFGVSRFFKKLCVHRGMFHSIPAMTITGSLIFLSYTHDSLKLRYYMAASGMVGFLSHLVLDELCSVDFSGLSVKLNQFAGSAVKMFGPSLGANCFCWVIALGLGYLSWVDYENHADAVKNGMHPSKQGVQVLPPPGHPLNKILQPVLFQQPSEDAKEKK